MQTKIYQINTDRDVNRVKFLGYDDLPVPFDPSIYDLVYEGDLEASDLEDLFSLLNVGAKPEGYRGHSLSVSDVVLNRDGAFFCDHYSWIRIEFWKEA